MTASSGSVVLCATTKLPARAAQFQAALGRQGVPVQRRDAPAPDDLAIWFDPCARSAARPGFGPVVVDLHLALLRGGAAGWQAETVVACRGAQLLLTASEAERGFWAAALDAAGVSIPLAVVPHAAACQPVPPETPLHTVLVASDEAPGPGTQDAARRIAAWATARGLRTGVAGPAGLAAVFDLGPSTAFGPGTVLVNLGTRPTSTAVLAEALAHGVPVLCNPAHPLLQHLLDAGAGWAIEGLDTALDTLAGLAPDRLHELAGSAIRLAESLFDPAQAARALHRALAQARSAHAAARAAWRQPRPALPKSGTVLVISDEAPNLLDIRIHLPLGALHRRGLLDGYAVLRHGEIAFTTAKLDARTQFSAIWVHRSADPGIHLLIARLGRPFVYDLDDNLLALPSYRAPFPAETAETCRALLHRCAVLSCATPGLLHFLQQAEGALAAKTLITPNLAGDAALTRPAAPPRAVVWASSDQPALTTSSGPIAAAVRDFCLAHDLPLVCLGAAPPAALAGSAVVVEHIGLTGYAAYLEHLRARAPAILVCPLETGADAGTQEFVDGKSDVKMLEAQMTGLVGVFSRAAPYEDSDLRPAILCANTYEAWLDGLAQARAACLHPGPAPDWPDHRTTAASGPAPWAEALSRAQLTSGLRLDELMDAVRFVHAEQHALLSSPDNFDEAYYLDRHTDVQGAVARQELASGYAHYRQSGFMERRAARKRPGAKASAETWWNGLIRTLDLTEAEVRDQEGRIAYLRGRAALRQHLHRPPPPNAKPEPQAHPSMDVQWHPDGARCDQPCPVCAAPGPHPVLLRADDHTLIRCTGCGSCFYEDRVFYDYEREKDAALLLQLYQEQNASIYHQTRLLFAIAGVDSVLDVGCGFGYPVDLAAKVLGWRATGIDPAFYASEGARLLGADIRKAYLTEQTELGEAFALVMASEVIEHMPDPYDFVALLRKWMRPGGTLVLTTPDAAALTPSLGAGSLIGILALKVHLILFTRESLELALRRAGFAHVQVDAAQDNLVAYASDQPLRFRPDAAAQHVQAYKTYLEHLVAAAAPGSPLWNGGAGRLFTLLANDAPLPVLHALFARIAAAWKEQFGIDLARQRLPPLLREADFANPDGSLPARLAATQPLNLPGVLFNRALVEYRSPGRTPEQVLAYARPAYSTAVQTRRVLQTEDMIDLDLKLTAWRARLLILDCLAELAPEVEGELLHAAGQDSPGTLHDRIDPPGTATVSRAAPFFIRAVQDDRFDEARRLEPWMRDMDLLCESIAGQPELLFRGLFTLGVLRLVGDGAPGPALEAFARMESEAARRTACPGIAALAREFQDVARDHVRLAAAQLTEAPPA